MSSFAPRMVTTDLAEPTTYGYATALIVDEYRAARREVPGILPVEAILAVCAHLEATNRVGNHLPRGAALAYNPAVVTAAVGITPDPEPPTPPNGTWPNLRRALDVRGSQPPLRPTAKTINTTRTPETLFDIGKQIARNMEEAVNDGFDRMVATVALCQLRTNSVGPNAAITFRRMWEQYRDQQWIDDLAGYVGDAYRQFGDDISLTLRLGNESNLLWRPDYSGVQEELIRNRDLPGADHPFIDAATIRGDRGPLFRGLFESVAEALLPFAAICYGLGHPAADREDEGRNPRSFNPTAHPGTSFVNDVAMNYYFRGTQRSVTALEEAFDTFDRDVVSRYSDATVSVHEWNACRHLDDNNPGPGVTDEQAARYIPALFDTLEQRYGPRLHVVSLHATRKEHNGYRYRFDTARDPLTMAFLDRFVEGDDQ